MGSKALRKVIDLAGDRAEASSCAKPVLGLKDYGGLYYTSILFYTWIIILLTSTNIG